MSLRYHFKGMSEVYLRLDAIKARAETVKQLLACIARSEQSCSTPSEQVANDVRPTQYFAVRTSARE